MKRPLKQYTRECGLRNKTQENIPVYSVTNSHGFVPSTDYFSKEVYSKDLSNYKIVSRGMIAYNPSRVNVGSLAVQNAEDKVIVSPLYVVFSVDESELMPEYVSYFLHSERGIKEIVAHTSGSVRDSLKFSALQDIEINICSLNEQAHIVSLLQKIERIIEKRRLVLVKIDDLVKSQFIEMFEGKNYRVIAIGDEFKTTSGGTPARSDNYENGVIPWMTSGEVSQGLIYEVKGRITEQGYNASSAKWMPINTVVVAMYGATAGQVGLLKIATTTNQAVCGIMPSEKFNPLFLYYAVKNQKEWMVAQSAGGAQPNISQAVIRRMRVPCPPKEEQNRFAHFAEQTDKSKFRIKQSLEKLETLYKALLQKYFG